MYMRPMAFILIIFNLLLPAGIQTDISAQVQSADKVPKVINFSGVITGADNKIVIDGEYKILFTLYENSEGGEPLWTELHSTTAVQNGEINVLLGEENPLNLEFNKQYYLGIRLNDGEELTPRIELIPAPFSIRTITANNIRDNSITSEKIADGSITDSKIKSVSFSKITDLPDVTKTGLRALQPQKALADFPYYWRRHGNYLFENDQFLGTINDRNLVIKTDSIQRMLFDPWGNVVMGTATDSVFFEVIGKTTLGDVYVKARMGVGADFHETQAKTHIKTTGTQTPFKVDNNYQEAFVIESNGRIEITSQQTGGDDEEGNYAMFVNSEDQGIAVKINGGTSNSDHFYMSFWDDDGIAGRIEGMDAADYFSDPCVIAHDAWLVAQGVALGVAVAANTAGLEIPDAVNGVAEIAYFTFQTTWDLTHLGVSFESGSGDYAEWLEKADPEESFTPGDILGVRRGKISKNTDNAEQIMCLSVSPVVLGNMPPKGKEKDFVKAAFKGQVPVKVKGIVHKGDYIIPSGFNDGMGIAVEPEMMTVGDFTKVVGRAWEENLNDDVKFINIAVGMKMKDLAGCLRRSYLENQQLENALAEKNKELDEILFQLQELSRRSTAFSNTGFSL